MSLTAFYCMVAFGLPFVLLGSLSWFKFNQTRAITDEMVENDLPLDEVPDQAGILKKVGKETGPPND